MGLLFDQFLTKFQESFKGKKPIVCAVLANVFSMRIVGNKTHGDLAEIALTEYINEFVEGYSAEHTGKKAFRAKSQEEDITVTNTKTNEKIKISIKTYGAGPLQLSTNKENTMFPFLKANIGEGEVTDPKKIMKILQDKCFSAFSDINILPLIYDEKDMVFKIIIFNSEKAYQTVRKVKYIPPRKLGPKQTFPIYKFYGTDDQYIFEVRYGGASANALQRGMWTHTENASDYFNEILKGSYEINEPLIALLSKIFILRREKHEEILSFLKRPSLE